MSRYEQLTIGGDAVPDPGRSGSWTRRGTASSARWLRVASLASEVKAALRRTRTTNAISPKQYREWAKGETRPIPVTFYDGTIDHKRLRIAAKRRQA